ncbi:LysR substrate-binding domain-containing protein [Kordiimonas aestuarii]|uniref:LysR substrate-binding domain-containing protein n=1 Tax=Kordiimonas aestuarii TaxID=1005925 RepID=UPI0021D33E7B|nr:LysR substrate-binding domain-containing protein [Kordiimonas aestuarii]
MDRFRALEVFVAVAEAGSLAGAARKLSISAPSVTRIVGDLESHLGVVLLHRTTRFISLTDVGAIYLEDARRILQDLDAANDAARGAHHTPKGHLRVTASTLFGQIYITPIISEYLNLYKDTTVEAVYLDRVVNLLEEGLDVAVRIGQLQDSSLIATRVGAVRSVVCGAPAYFEKHGLPHKPEDLHDHTLIALKLANSRPGWRFADGEIKVKPRLEFTSVPAAIAAAKKGIGLTRVLSYQIAPELEAGTLQTVMFDHAPEPLPIHILYGDGRRASGKVRAFVDLAVAQLRGNPFLN